MKKTELTKIKELSIKELISKAKDLKKEIENLAIDKNRNKLKDTKKVFRTRKDLAQVLTVLRQKQLLGQLESRVESQESSEKLEEPKKKERKKKTSF